MESKTTRVIALIGFGVSMFVLGWVLNCGANKCSSKKSCGKQWGHTGGKIDGHSFSKCDFKGDTAVYSTDKYHDSKHKHGGHDQ